MTPEEKAQHLRIVERMQAILNKADAEIRDLTADEKECWEGLANEADALAGRSNREDTLKHHAAIQGMGTGRQKPEPLGSTGRGSQMCGEQTAEGGCVRALSVNEPLYSLPGGQQLPQGIRAEDLSLTRILRGKILGEWRGADRELRALGEGTGSLGGFFIPDALSSMLVDLARAKAVTQQAGALTVVMEQPTMHIVRVKSDPVGYWRAEHGEIPESDPTFDRVTLNAHSLGVMVRVSVEALQDASNFEVTIRNLISSAIALEIDKCALLANGVGMPIGILGLTASNPDGTPMIPEIAMGTNGAALTSYDPFSLAVQTIMEANGPSQGLAVIHSPRTWGAIDRLKEGGTGAPLQPPKSYASLRELVTSTMPTNLTKGSASNTSTSIVGDFKNLILGMLGGVMIESSRVAGSAFSNGDVLIRALVRCDTGIVRPNHFAKVVGIKP